MPRIQHVTVNVPAEEDLAPVEAFYAALGGVALVRPPMLVADTPGCWLGFGDTQLHLIVGEPNSTGAHFALDLGAAFDAGLAALAAVGAEVRPARPLWGARRAFVRDPAGNLVELFDAPPDSTPVR